MSFLAPQLLQMYAPNLASSADASNWLQLGRESLNTSVLGSSYEEAVALFAAHRMTLVQRMMAGNGATGAVTSQSVGSISQSYASPSAKPGWEDFASTPYGIRLQQLLLLCGTTMQVLDPGEDLIMWRQPMLGPLGLV